ncbi:MAG: glycosyltransferase [Chitinispirillaceae bacterium]|nr:glycosyltransferase [Chitinispirillaceae bacterium]
MNSLVSVVIAAYNCEKTIRQSLESVLSQSYCSIEIVLVDDCSSDGTAEIMAYYKNLHPEKIKFFINEKNRGVSFSRNLALNYVCGKYISFLDGDDYWDKTKIEKQVAVLENGDLNVDVVHTGVFTVYDRDTELILKKEKFFIKNEDVFSYVLNNVEKDVKKHGNSYFNMLKVSSPICFSSCMFTKKIIDTIGGFDESLDYQAEDRLLWLSAAAISKFYFLPNKLTYYRLHKDSYTFKNIVEKKINYDLLNAQVIDRFFLYDFIKTKMISYRNFYDGVFLSTRFRLFWNKIGKQFFLIVSRIFYNSRRRFLYLNKSKLDIGLLILFITKRCNFKCSFCFVEQKSSDMKLEIVNRITNGINTGAISITGGEPFLHPKISEIICACLNKCCVEINTNGFFTKKIYKSILSSLKNNNTLNSIVVNISLDGLPEVHNSVRKNSLAYIKALDSIRSLMSLRSVYPNLRVGVNTVINSTNFRDTFEFVSKIYNEMRPDFHSFEFDRFSTESKKCFSENKDLFKTNVLKICGYLKKRYGFHGKETSKRIQKQLRIILDNESWGSYCGVYKDVVVVYPDGKVPVCEMRSEFLELKDYDNNISCLIKSEEAKNLQEKIIKEKCNCLHGCWLIPALKRVQESKC